METPSKVPEGHWNRHTDRLAIHDFLLVIHSRLTMGLQDSI